MREEIAKFLNGYIAAKNEMFAGSEFGTFVRKNIPAAIRDTGLLDDDIYKVTGSVGQGNWAAVPWIGIFNTKVTDSATKGVYIAYLLSTDGKKLYLAFLQGCTEIKNTYGKKKTISIMRQNAREIASKIRPRGFASDENISLGDNRNELALLYQKGTIFYKTYKQEDIPSEQQLREDLRNVLDIYQDYIKIFQGGEPAVHPSTAEVKESEQEMPISTKEVITLVKNYITAEGFTYPDGLIENFFLSLKSKPFVILAGTSGTGKTRLVKLFAEAIGAQATYKLIPVRPDWSDSTDLFGHVDLNGKFIPGEILDFIKEADKHRSSPYFLCLDEMNLARVEYYLSDFLSIIETRDFKDGKLVSAPLISEKQYGGDVNALEDYGELRFPPNLYIIGTVNMDETTFPFSKKVLDRANTIEFDYVDLNWERKEKVAGEAQQIPNSFLRTEFLRLEQCTGEDEYITVLCKELQDINDILKKANAHVGYRVRDEIVFYMLNNKREGQLLTEEQALDNEILQKILPRIQGSSASVKEMLCDLFKHFGFDYTQYNGESIPDKMKAALEKNSSPSYRKSAEKIKLMVQRFEEDGFTSYWL